MQEDNRRVEISGTFSAVTQLPLIAPRPHGGEQSSGFWRRLSSLTPKVKPLLRERRATPRVKVEIECEERVGDSRYFHITSDLSTFGLSTRQGGPYPVGTHIQILLHLPDGHPQPVETDAVVVAAFSGRDGLRLAFKRTPLDSVRRIHQYVMRKISEGVAP